MSILDMHELAVQLDVYECKATQNNKRTYNAKPPFHDDIVMAMMLCLDCIKKGSYCIR